jgi:toxin YhaV
MTTRQSNGWQIFFTDMFDARWRELRTSARHIEKRQKPEDAAKDADVKLFIALVRIVHEIVPQNPNADEFRLGKTLGDDFTEWRRVKGHGLPDRMRLFFRFGTSKEKVNAIVFAWLNDEHTLRKANGKTDVYAVFQKMLKAKNPPTTLVALLAGAKTGKGQPAVEP